MPALSWPEIRNRATAFAREWKDVTSERAEAQTFWNEFFEIFGVKRRRVAIYEQRVELLPNAGHTKTGRIDVFWPRTMLAEHKSAGADLTAAHKQAIDYFAGIANDDWPRYVIVSDFQRFRFYDLDRRRQLGAHYTSEANIRKVIGPLFLDDLRAEFESVKHNQNRLFAFHKKLLGLTFLDPACGCGNFLVVTYRELRRLEIDIFLAAQNFGAVSHIFEAAQINVDQFYGIEIEEFPAQIAQVAMWLTDHQMNVEAGREFGEFFARIPLDRSAAIRRSNALRLEWEDLVPPNRLSYILGNPPFVGAKFMNSQQREDFAFVSKDVANAGLLDYVAGWYLKAAQYLSGSKEGALSRDKKQFQDTRFGKQAPGIEDIFVELEQADDKARKRIRCGLCQPRASPKVSRSACCGAARRQDSLRSPHVQVEQRSAR